MQNVTSTLNANTIAAKIKFQNGRFNGHSNLVDAFLKVLPSTEKAEGKDKEIEALYSDVKRVIFGSRTSFVVPQPEQHWALM